LQHDSYFRTQTTSDGMEIESFSEGFLDNHLYLQLYSNSLFGRFRNASPGGMNRPGSYDDDGRYGNRDEDRNGYGYGKEREYNYRDDERYGKYGDSYGRDGDHNGEERYGRDGYRDDDYQGRSRSIDDYGSRSRSSDRDRDHAFDDDGQSSSRYCSNFSIEFFITIL